MFVVWTKMASIKPPAFPWESMLPRMRAPTTIILWTTRRLVMKMAPMPVTWASIFETNVKVRNTRCKIQTLRKRAIFEPHPIPLTKLVEPSQTNLSPKWEKILWTTNPVRKVLTKPPSATTSAVEASTCQNWTNWKLINPQSLIILSKWKSMVKPELTWYLLTPWTLIIIHGSNWMSELMSRRTGNRASIEMIRQEKACNPGWSRESIQRKYQTIILTRKVSKMISNSRAFSLSILRIYNQDKSNKTRNKRWRIWIWINITIIESLEKVIIMSLIKFNSSQLYLAINKRPKTIKVQKEE